MSGANLLDYYKDILQKNFTKKTVKSSSTFYCLEYYMVCIFNNKSWDLKTENIIFQLLILFIYL